MSPADLEETAAVRELNLVDRAEQALRRCVAIWVFVFEIDYFFEQGNQLFVLSRVEEREAVAVLRYIVLTSADDQQMQERFAVPFVPQRSLPSIFESPFRSRAAFAAISKYLSVVHLPESTRS